MATTMPGCRPWLPCLTEPVDAVAALMPAAPTCPPGLPIRPLTACLRIHSSTMFNRANTTLSARALPHSRPFPRTMSHQTWTPFANDGERTTAAVKLLQDAVLLAITTDTNPAGVPFVLHLLPAFQLHSCRHSPALCCRCCCQHVYLCRSRLVLSFILMGTMHMLVPVLRVVGASTVFCRCRRCR